MYLVAPPVGAWIEIGHQHLCTCLLHVAPPVGAWIEIFKGKWYVSRLYRRSPRGSVD